MFLCWDYLLEEAGGFLLVDGVEALGAQLRGVHTVQHFLHSVALHGAQHAEELEPGRA